MIFRIYLLFLIVFSIHYAEGRLWQDGVVYYTINTKDYDLHSQDIISTTLEKLEREICIKFFKANKEFKSTDKGRLLFITNPDKQKFCSLQSFDYSKNVIETIIGYHCLNEHNIAVIITEMLKASVRDHDKPINVSESSMRKSLEELSRHNGSLVTTSDRNYLNGHYDRECNYLVEPVITNVIHARRNPVYYENRLWPLGIIIYGLDRYLENTHAYHKIKYAMNAIEHASCITFQEIRELQGIVDSNHYIWFGSYGRDDVPYGFQKDIVNLTLNINTFADGAPGHTAHAINLLMRILGVPMMSNRHDRNNYITVDWTRVPQEKRVYLRQEPETGFLNTTYDFYSVTHAPTNFMCSNCLMGETSVTPLNDFLWQKSLNMGKGVSLTDVDREIMKILYQSECAKRTLG